MSSTPHADPIRLSLPFMATQTEVLLGHGLLANPTAFLRLTTAGQLVLVSDHTVGSRYAAPLRDRLRAVGLRAELLLIAEGEHAKSLETLSELYHACLQLQLERQDVLLAVGGGVVGDLVGMLAGTYMRGVRYAQIPTTLVAMVTASVGGKVGVNFMGEKNLIGLFNPPEQVLADLDTLATLPDPELRSGLGELITVGVLGAPAIFEALERDADANLAGLVAEAIRTKGAIVEADPYDQTGIRAQLNLGHTFGHALERLSDFTLPHGIAVGVGLQIASQLAAALGRCPADLPERISAVMRRLNLPTMLSGYAPDAVIAAMRGDKKRRGGRLRWVTPTRIGAVELLDEDTVPPELLRAILARVLWQPDPPDGAAL